MNGKQTDARHPVEALDAMPLSEESFAHIARDLRLSPQQSRIVALILRGQKDAQIARHMSLSVPTIRTYLKRIFERVGVDNRIRLILKIFTLSHNVDNQEQDTNHVK